MICKLVEANNYLSCFGCIFYKPKNGYRLCVKPKDLEKCGDDIYVIVEIKNV